MNKANECTCPSGDGSLVHPCPAHPAVEQAGGDERAADAKPCATRCPDCGEHDLMPGDLCACGYETDPATGYACSECDGSGEGCVGEVCRECDGSGWFVTPDQARAALAQPSPVRSSLLINGYQLRAALEFIAPDGTAEQLESEACIEWRQQDADFLEAGLYAFCAEYPEEGGVLLDEEPTTAQPSPLQSEQANAGYDQLWAWFGLSRSAYAVLPRVMMHAMPDDWQRRFAELMDEWDDHWPNQPDITAHVQIKQNNRFISTPPWLLNYRHPDHNQLNAMRGKDEL
ncbi:hypothetical protein [Pseudomonas aeruginosa]|uniref:hypothetical protein n=1 Tax=Pseudomonas aeruginosa TaxID=287 RepID=UPI001885AE03|nr:hypothetical protein [Pseudomonas aeruginosa]